MAKPLTPCGTIAAYHRHVKRGEDICASCRRAARLHRSPDAFVIPDLPELPEALCREVDPELFIPSSTNASANALTHKKAAAICAICTEREPCLEYALSFPARQISGTWGGTSQPERIALRKQRAGEAA